MQDFSIYFLSPDRRFAEGGASFSESVIRARKLVLMSTDSRDQKIESVEVWDNETQLPVYGVERQHRGKLDERFADGYEERLLTPTSRPESAW